MVGPKRVRSLSSPLPSLTPYSSGDIIHVTLAAPTALAKISSVRCSDVIIFKPLTSGVCDWVNRHTLSIRSLQPSVTPGTTTISLVPNVVVAAPDASTTATSGAVFGSGTVTVTISTTIQNNPFEITLVGPSQIGPCDNLRLQLIVAGAVGAGRPTIEWFLGTPPVKASMEGFLQNAGSNGGKFLRIPANHVGYCTSPRTPTLRTLHPFTLCAPRIQ